MDYNRYGYSNGAWGNRPPFVGNEFYGRGPTWWEEDLRVSRLSGRGRQEEFRVIDEWPEVLSEGDVLTWIIDPPPHGDE